MNDDKCELERQSEMHNKLDDEIVDHIIDDEQFESEITIASDYSLKLLLA